MFYASYVLSHDSLLCGLSKLSAIPVADSSGTERRVSTVAALTQHILLVRTAEDEGFRGVGRGRVADVPRTRCAWGGLEDTVSRLTGWGAANTANSVYRRVLADTVSIV